MMLMEWKEESASGKKMGVGREQREPREGRAFSIGRGPPVQLKRSLAREKPVLIAGPK